MTLRTLATETVVASRNLTMLSRAICGSRGQLLRRPSARHFRVADPAAAQARLHLECAPMAEAVVERLIGEAPNEKTVAAAVAEVLKGQ